MDIYQLSRILNGNRTAQLASLNFRELTLHKVIGVGAFGEVIKATYLHTPVVVKRMLRHKINESNLRLFCSEIKLMMGLRHPNIIQFIGASWNSYSNICFVTEFLQRGDLFSVLQDPKQSLSWKNPVLDMTVGIARGMAYLHSLKPPILHRDLKSMNILVNENYHCKISDFGLSRELKMDETMSITGTPLWMAPEMIRGDVYDQKVDVYSFGIVISEMDTRKVPYHDARPNSSKHIAGTALMQKVSFSKFRPTLSTNCMESVRKLYERCIDDNPANRPTFVEIIKYLDYDIRQEIKEKNYDFDAMDYENFDPKIAKKLGVTRIKYCESIEVINSTVIES